MQKSHQTRYKNYYVVRNARRANSGALENYLSFFINQRMNQFFKEQLTRRVIALWKLFSGLFYL